MLEASGRGHLGSAFSQVEMLRVLYDDVLRYKPDDPKWPGRDRFVLSKGQGCLSLYVLLAEKGFFPESELWKCGKSDGLLGGHPENKIPGVEASTGSLGHGLSYAIGFALNARYEKADHRSFVIVGDGECNEGSIWEAAMSAAKHKLSNLTILVDYNKHQSYGSTSEVLDLEPFGDKWRSFGMGVIEVDGHSVDQLRSVLLNLPVEPGKPSAIICHTIKGKGVDYVENNMEWHHKNRVSAEEIRSLLEALETE
jgi:transketolase